MNKQGITILKKKKKNDNFHARFSAKLRIYKYIITNRLGGPVLEKDRSWHIIKKLDLELMKNYRSKLDLNLQEIGSVNIIPYPIEFGEVDVEKNIPIGKRNMNSMAVLLAIDEYDDIDFIDFSD